MPTSETLIIYTCVCIYVVNHNSIKKNIKRILTQPSDFFLLVSFCRGGSFCSVFPMMSINIQRRLHRPGPEGKVNIGTLLGHAKSAKRSEERYLLGDKFT